MTRIKVGDALLLWIVDRYNSPGGGGGRGGPRGLGGEPAPSGADAAAASAATWALYTATMRGTAAAAASAAALAAADAAPATPTAASAAAAASVPAASPAAGTNADLDVVVAPGQSIDSLALGCDRILGWFQVNGYMAAYTVEPGMRVCRPRTVLMLGGCDGRGCN